MARIYLVRHGTTEWNREEIFRGRVDCPLDETGRAEARALAVYFGELPIERIFTSPLARAAETAAAIAAGRGVEAVSDPAFIDLDFGEWQGHPLRAVREKYPDLYRAWRERPQEVTFPGGESLARARARAWDRLLQIARENPDQTAVIVSHRVITKILICAALGLDHSHFWQIKQDTTAVNCLEFSRRGIVLSLLNDTCHLKSIHPRGERRDF